MNTYLNQNESVSNIFQTNNLYQKIEIDQDERQEFMSHKANQLLMENGQLRQEIDELKAKLSLYHTEKESLYEKLKFFTNENVDKKVSPKPSL